MLKAIKQLFNSKFALVRDIKIPPELARFQEETFQSRKNIHLKTKSEYHVVATGGDKTKSSFRHRLPSWTTEMTAVQRFFSRDRLQELLNSEKPFEFYSKQKNCASLTFTRAVWLQVFLWSDFATQI